VCHSYSYLNFGVTFLEHSVYYDILNRLRVDHECDRSTDRRTDRQAALAIARSLITVDAR